MNNISIQEFEQFFKQHYAELCGFANKYLNDVDAAEEAVQQVFVKLWEKRESVKITSSVRSYLYSSVKNACLNQIKHIQIREEYKAHNQREIEQNTSRSDEEVEAGELEQQIHTSINKLPEKRRKIFILSRYEGLKYKEIAEKLNVSIKTVENQMGSAIKQLKTDLAEFLVTLLVLFMMLK